MKLRKALFLVASMFGIAGAVAQSDVAEAARVCPNPGLPDDNFQTATNPGSVDCWVGPSYAQGLTLARGILSVVNPPGGSQGRLVQAYLFGPGAGAASCAKAWGMNTNTGLHTCAASDNTQDHAPHAVSGNPSPQCDYTNMVYVTAYNTTTCT